MKLLESKYYEPTQIMSERYINGTYQVTVSDLLHALDASDTPYSDSLIKRMPHIEFKDRVIRCEHLQDFEQCTDYHVYEYSEKKQRFYNLQSCYFHAEYEIFLITTEGISDDENTDNDESFDKNIMHVSQIHYNSKNPQALSYLQKFTERYLEKYASKNANISILVKEERELAFKKHKIRPLHVNLNTMYNADFLAVHKKISHELINSNKGVVMLHGISGSGKTNYLKWLTSQIPNKDFVFVPNNMIQLLLDPSFINLLIDNKNSVIVLEDCENYILEREASQTNTDVVASILNIADGMLSDVLECQFICTFNAKLAKVDHALLRKGRLIAEYYFTELDVDRCNAYLKSIDKETEVYNAMSLAELTNIDSEAYLAEEPTKKFGFV